EVSERTKIYDPSIQQHDTLHRIAVGSIGRKQATHGKPNDRECPVQSRASLRFLFHLAPPIIPLDVSDLGKPVLMAGQCRGVTVPAMLLQSICDRFHIRRIACKSVKQQCVRGDGQRSLANLHTLIPSYPSHLWTSELYVYEASIIY